MVIVNGSYFEVTAHTLTLIDHGASGLEMNVDVQFTHTAGTFAGAVFYRAQLFKAGQATPVYTLYSNTLGLTSHRITRDASDIVVEAGSYTLKVFAQLNGSAEADAYAESDVVLVDGGGDPFGDEIKYRLVENRELTWEEGDSNFRILDRRSRAQFSLPENSFWKGDATNKPIPVDFEGAVAATEAVSGKQSKHLSLNHTWVGNAEGLADEFPIAGFSPFKTVGTGGEFLTIKAAYAAGHTNLVQVGNIAENETFEVNNKRILFLGNRNFTLTWTATVTWFTGSTYFDIYFYNTTLVTSTARTFANGKAHHVKFYNCSVTLGAKLLDDGGNARLTAIDSVITITLNETTLYAAETKLTRCSLSGNGNRLYALIATDISLSGTWGDINFIAINGLTGSASGILIAAYGNAVISNVLATNLDVRTNQTSYIFYASNCELKSVGNYVAGIYKFSNCRFTGGATTMLAGSVLTACRFGAAVTVSNDVEMIACTTTGLTLTSIDNKIIGGVHTTIAVNGSKNLVTGVRATSITIASSLSKCRISQNITTNAITETDPASHYYAGNFTA